MKEFEMIWDIYCESFPIDEQRTLKQQMEIMKDSKYSVNPYYDDNKIIGFYTSWNLYDFIYIDHLAVHKRYRGMGLGSKLVQQIQDKYEQNNIILEVEQPNTHEAEKRIEFYSKKGFNLNDYEYYQPAFDDNKKSVPLLIMSYPLAISEEEFFNVRDKLYSEVYGVDNNIER
ncbi:N-acetyltransferase [Vallitalea longa]|uniref:N-acetyltransferase n=1 Tax=Vallitalea longa TaxID=2936439 RepID=A0A9W5Y937_9FIRM|nr:GNAT family N-acetyltransferase [Vallitalea longa]GKX28280.1 N-acetyltransferase [Vallitalea longa]